jgi:hypothetical protein
MAKATKDTLGVSNLTVVADTGYSSGTTSARLVAFASISFRALPDRPVARSSRSPFRSQNVLP